MMVGAGREVAGKEERAVDITDISDKQTEIDNDIIAKWGNPSTSQLTLLSGTITQSSINGSTGDYWYYLNSDITANFSGRLYIDRGNVRIVLNGYSISGNLQMDADDGNATLSIFDKIPGKSGTGYTYNSNPVKYYKYNSSTGAYTDYSTTAPSGTDVTNMPTFKANTYIKITGSAISPNALNTGIMTLYLGTESSSVSKLNMYSINVVGCTPYGSVMIASNGGTLNFYQSTIIGNKVTSYVGALGFWSQGTINIEGCKVYGNKGNSSYGVQPSDTNLADRIHDIGFDNGGNGKINIYKCNVGAIINNSNTNSVYIKDVDFGNKKAIISNNTVSTFFTSISDISGTIELVYNNSITYTGNSPNLNFIVHGNDSDSNPKKGKNNLTVNGICGNITTAFDDSTVVNTITINGTCSGVATKGNVTIGSNGKVSTRQGQTIGGTFTNNGNFIIPEGVSYTIASGKSIGGTVTNNGTLNLEGTVSNLINNSIVNITGSGAAFTSVTNNGNLVLPQGKSYTISSGQTLGGRLTNQGTLTIASGATVTNPIDNAGTLNVSGTVSDVYGYGSVNVNANGNVTIPEGKEAGTISNQGGTLTVAGSANNVTMSAGTTIKK